MKWLILLTLISCASLNRDRFVNVDDGLKYYVALFDKEYQKRTKKSIDNSIFVNFDRQKHGKSLGYYDLILDKTFINRTEWDNLSHSFRELLLFHELGHSVLKRIHRNNDFLEDGCPDSIMFWALNEDCYKKHKNRYLDELFSKEGEITWGPKR